MLALFLAWLVAAIGSSWLPVTRYGINYTCTQISLMDRGSWNRRIALAVPLMDYSYTAFCVVLEAVDATTAKRCNAKFVTTMCNEIPVCQS